MDYLNTLRMKKCEFCGVYPGQLHHPYLCPRAKEPEEPAGPPEPVKQPIPEPQPAGEV